MKVNQVDDHFYLSADETNTFNELPVANYSVAYCEIKGFYLIKKEEFEIPAKIYGRSTMPERILNTYHKLGHGIGVLFSGPKGSGKPVVMITTGFANNDFSNFLGLIETPAIILIDEFEKIYEEEEKRNFFLS